MDEKDHRIIGKEMNLFSFHEEAPGFPFYKKNFLIIRDSLLEYLQVEQQKLGYELLETPAILRNDLWVQSGHWEFYRENMYWMQHDDNVINVVKPMHCPGGVLVYKEDIHSYRELPLKFAEIGKLYRKERSGSIQGLLRTREYLLDDAHIYMREDQIAEVINEIIDLIELVYGKLGFEFDVALSTRPEKSIGSDENWINSTEILKDVLDKRKIPYIVKKGDGSFYGPKIDFDIKDSLNRKWQCGTIQLDYNLPERFDLFYVDSELNKQRVIMLHRAILGGIERLIAIMLEHYQGKLPLWLAPEQVLIININEEVLDYCKLLKKSMDNNGIRSNIDNRNETLDKRIREASKRKINYLVIIGSREKNQENISVRRRDGKQFNKIERDEFIEQLKSEIFEKELASY